VSMLNFIPQHVNHISSFQPMSPVFSRYYLKNCCIEMRIK